MVTNQSKDNPKKFATNGDQSFELNHAIVQVSLVLLVQNTILTHNVQSCKIQKLTNKRSPAFRNTPPAFLLAAAYFKKIQTSILQQFGNGFEFAEIAYFPNQPRHRDHANAFNRNNKMAVWHFFKIKSHLLFNRFNKLVTVGNKAKNLLNLIDDTVLAILQTNRILRQTVERFSALAPQATVANPSQNLSQTIQTKHQNCFRSRIVVQKVVRATTLQILHYAQKFRKNQVHGVMQLIIKRFTTLLMAFPGMAQTTKLCNDAFRNHNRKETPQFNKVCYHFRVFVIGLVRRIIINLLNSPGVGTINLNQPHTALFQKMHHRLCIRPGRFKTNNYFVQTMTALHPGNFTPEFLKSFAGISKFHRRKLCAVRTTTIANILSFSKINCSYQGFLVDYAFTFT